MAVLDPPYQVSPLIRLARWSLLISGIAWGYHRHKVNRKTEDDYLAYIEKMKPIWMEKKKKHLQKLEREQMLSLSKDFGVPVPANFDEKYPIIKE